MGRCATACRFDQGRSCCESSPPMSGRTSSTWRYRKSARSSEPCSCSTGLKTPTCAGEHEQRSEEHTSEIQSLMRISYAVFCLKKKKKHHKPCKQLQIKQ